ncbi:MAG: agmatine deiminase family protein, partial [Acidobacteria bacterium]|nr:agmatine deiminase family protein [Acidobacteriota bacterium]
PMPAPIERRVRGQDVRLPASYLNFYIANQAVLIPAYGAETDPIATRILARAFPERTIVPIDCRDLVYGAGTLHCITQQQPAINP